ncbi:MAG: glycosyltransferase family 4 protein [Patescibacteria group bacterium]
MTHSASNILIFSPAFRPLIGGSELALEALMRHMPGRSFVVLTPRYSTAFPARESHENVRIRRIGFGVPWLDKYLFLVFGATIGLREARHAAVLHAYQASYAALAALVVRFFSRVPLIVTLQEGAHFQKQSLLVRAGRWLAVRYADRVTAISSPLEIYARHVRRGVGVTLVPNGVDPAHTCTSEERSRLRTAWGIRADEVCIYSASRLVSKNGIDALVRACAALSFPWRLVVAGAGERARMLQQLAVELGVSDRVVWRGSVSHGEVLKELGAIDVYARPSRSEGQGIAFLEAMAAGVPVVASRRGGLRDFMRDGETGFVCDPDDIPSIVDALTRASRPGAERDTVVTTAGDMISREYLWSLIAPRMAAVYDTLA